MKATSGDGLVDRSSTLAALRGHMEAVQASGRGRILAIRGRRQVGKSTVVSQFVASESTPSIVVQGIKGLPVHRQLDDATRAIAESSLPVVDAELLAGAAADSWRDWFGRLALAARSGPVVAVLDEFPWMAVGDPTLVGELQAQWDRTLERLPVLLVLIGSDVAMMERLSEHDDPLFGRVRPLVVSPLDPAEVAHALPGLDPTTVIDAYLFTGGYPRLVTDLAASGRSPAEHVREALTDAYSPLVATARLTLDAEFPAAPAAYRVLSAIGADDTVRPAFTDVLSAIHDTGERKAAETATTRALKTLTEVKQLVERESPAWSTPKGRLHRYRVTDPYLRFWFRYVERRVEQISAGRADLAVAAFERDWSSWRGRSVEPVVRAALTRLARSDRRLVDIEDVRPWWTRDGSVEVDAVAMTSQRTAMIGSIKWGPDGVVTEREVEQLRNARSQVPRADGATLAMISPSGHRPRGADVAFGAHDLLDAWRVAT